jgi:hypothetical protein
MFRSAAMAGILTFADTGLYHAIWFRRKVFGGIIYGIGCAIVSAAVFA